MAARLTRNVPLEVALATTLTRLIPGDGVGVVHVSTPSDVYLVLDDSLDDGAAVPATARFRIPAGAIWPVDMGGPRALLAAVSGTADVGLLGTSAVDRIAGLLGGAGGGVLIGWCGTGADGADTIVGTETLVAEMHYTDLTVPVGTVLNTGGFRIHVSGTLTLDGTIRDNGNNASGITAGAALANQGLRIQTGAGGTGRNTTGNGSAGGAYGSSYAYPDCNPVGGNGGAVTSGTAGAGATASTQVDNLAKKPLARVLAGDSHLISVSGVRYERPGAGGGSGGANVGTGTAISGGGGGGAGVVQVLAQVLTGAGVFESKGGNGGNAACTGNGAAGGGGGGTGNRVEVVAGEADGWTGTMVVTGGAIGTSVSETVVPTAGGDGIARLYVLS